MLQTHFKENPIYLQLKKEDQDNKVLFETVWKTIDFDDLMYVQEHCPVTFTIVNWDDEDTGHLTAYKMHY